MDYPPEDGRYQSREDRLRVEEVQRAENRNWGEFSNQCGGELGCGAVLFDKPRHIKWHQSTR